VHVLSFLTRPRPHPRARVDDSALGSLSQAAVAVDAGPRKSARLSKPIERFAETEHSGANMDSRLGARHERVYETSRAELELGIAALLQRQEEMVGELRSLSDQADALVERLPENERKAAIFLQQALVELIDDDSDTESDDGSDADGEAACSECEPLSVLRLKDINFESSPRRTLRPAVAPPAVGIQTTLPAAAGRAADGTAGRAGARGRGGGGRGRGARGRGSSCGGGRGGGEPVRQELSWLGVDTHNLIMACVRDEN
jgi:hypothetical protein